MIAKLLISTSLEKRSEEIKRLMEEAGLNTSHPDLLFFPADSKLGVEQARQIKQFLSLKPFGSGGKVVVLEDASELTTEAQNALLKTIEELPKTASFIMGADSDSKFLPTILSRCQIIRLQAVGNRSQTTDYTNDIEKLLDSDIPERFEYVAGLKDKEKFFQDLVGYFHQKLPENPGFAVELLRSEEWVKQNVNIRAILEYLMLVMPQKV